MRFVSVLLFVVFFLSSVFGQTPEVQARMTSISTKQCSRGQSSYDFDIEGTFEVENMSKKKVLVAKSIEDVLSVTAASSLAEAKRGVYSFDIDSQFGGITAYSTPRLENFVAIKPGQKALVQIGAVVSMSIDPKYIDNGHLGPGKYWFKFHYSTIPSYWSRKDINFWKNKWRSTGYLLNGDFVTDSFPVDVARDPEAPKCAD